MTDRTKALLLVGSPKGSRSASWALGTYLLDQLKAEGMAAECVEIHSALKTGQRTQEMLRIVERCDLLILASPLYVDCLPSQVIRFMELSAGRRKAQEIPRKQKLAVILNCGFPEKQHNQTAISICRCFADECGLEWAGALAMGMGGAASDKVLDRAGGMFQNVRKGLKIATSALSQGRCVPLEAADLVAKPLMPLRLYVAAANFGWKSQAQKFGVKKRLNARPFLRNEK